MERKEKIKQQIIRLQLLKVTNRNNVEIEKWIQSLYKKLLKDEK